MNTKELKDIFEGKTLKFFETKTIKWEDMNWEDIDEVFKSDYTQFIACFNFEVKEGRGEYGGFRGDYDQDTITVKKGLTFEEMVEEVKELAVETINEDYKENYTFDDFEYIEVLISLQTVKSYKGITKDLTK